MHGSPPATPPRHRPMAWIVLLAYMALLAVLSHQPSLPRITGWVPHQDKVAHFLAYALLGALAHRALPGAGVRRLLGAVFLAGLFGVSDELHQALVPGRDPSLLDWLADALGSTAGAIGAGYLGPFERKFRRFLKKPATVVDL